MKAAPTSPPDARRQRDPLGVFSGTAILLFAVAWRTGLSLVPSRAAA